MYKDAHHYFGLEILDQFESNLNNWIVQNPLQLWTGIASSKILEMLHKFLGFKNILPIKKVWSKRKVCDCPILSFIAGIE